MTVPKQGRTCAGRKEDIGKIAALYTIKDGNQIGDLICYLQIEDTGSHERLQKGSIDVYRNTLDECWDWIHEYGDYCYVQIIDAEG